MKSHDDHAEPKSHAATFDGLRGLACLAVFGVHFHQITSVQFRAKSPLASEWLSFDLARLLENGNTGVAILFMLSAFHLSLPLWQQRIPGKRLQWLSHYARSRVARIVPAYYLVLGALVVYQRLWQTSEGRADALLHFLFLHTFREETFYSINNPFWTIGIQAQFYLLFVPFILGLSMMGRRRIAQATVIATTVIAAYALQFALMEHGDDWLNAKVSSHHTVFGHSVLAHWPLFALGMLSGGAANRIAAKSSSSRQHFVCDAICWSTFFFLLVVLSTPLDDRLQMPHGRYNWPWIPLALCVSLAALQRAPLASAALALRPLSGLGAISYGVYLFHLPCLRLVERLMAKGGLTVGHNALVFGVASLALTMVLATVSYLLLERPILAWAAPSRKNQTPGAISAVGSHAMVERNATA